jgi:hypothetical protein
MVWEPYARYALGLLDSVQFGVEVNVMVSISLFNFERGLTLSPASLEIHHP